MKLTAQPRGMFLSLDEVAQLTGLALSTLHAEAKEHGTVLNGKVKVHQTTRGSAARHGRLHVVRHDLDRAVSTPPLPAVPAIETKET